MVREVALTDDYMRQANAFLRGGNENLPEFFKFEAGAYLGNFVDHYVEYSPDSLSWLAKPQDGVVGVWFEIPQFDRYGDVVATLGFERSLWHTGQILEHECEYGIDENDMAHAVCKTHRQIGDTNLDPGRVAAFSAAVFGFASLHEGEAKRYEDGEPVLDALGHIVYDSPGQMDALCGYSDEGNGCYSYTLDVALSTFGRCGSEPEAIVITASLQHAGNAFLQTATAVDPNNPFLQENLIEDGDVGHILMNRQGVLRVIDPGNVDLTGQQDVSPSKLVYFNGQYFGMRCADDVHCKLDGYIVEEGFDYLEVESTNDKLMLSAALFGFGSIVESTYTNQWCPHLSASGSVGLERRQRLDAAFEQFAPYRRDTIQATQRRQDMAALTGCCVNE